MGQSAAQAAAFFEEIAAGHQVWTVKDENGYIAPLNGEGRRAMPFWSKHSRAERVIATVAVYRDFETVAITLDAWRHLRIHLVVEEHVEVPVFDAPETHLVCHVADSGHVR
jgi:hypothetical protein